MTRTLDRQRALELRAQGKSYSQIRTELGINKSTLSGWLRRYPLSREQIRQLRDLSQIRIEKFRQTCRNKWISRLSRILESQTKEILPLTEKELFLSGVFLYWGEGSKQKGRISVSNTDPRVINFALYWMTQILKVPREKLQIRLHLYSDMDINEETHFWSRTLNIPIDQFKTSYIKTTTQEAINYKSFGHGTCNLIYFSVALSEKIAMTIKAISEFYGTKSDLFWYN